METTVCNSCGKEINDGLECTYCGNPVKTEGPYQLICYAYYCGWKSDVIDDIKEVEGIEKCPRCGVIRGPKLQLETV